MHIEFFSSFNQTIIKTYPFLCIFHFSLIAYQVNLYSSNLPFSCCLLWHNVYVSKFLKSAYSICTLTLFPFLPLQTRLQWTTFINTNWVPELLFLREIIRSGIFVQKYYVFCFNRSYQIAFQAIVIIHISTRNVLPAF